MLVHCAQGMSRSVSILAAYLMWKEHISTDTALEAIKSARPCSNPNEGFVAQLREFEGQGWVLEAWQGWSKEKLEAAILKHSTSGRRVVHTFSDIIRRFHCHSLTDDDLVYRMDESEVLDMW